MWLIPALFRYFNFGGVAPNATEESYMQTICSEYLRFCCLHCSFFQCFRHYSHLWRHFYRWRAISHRSSITPLLPPGPILIHLVFRWMVPRYRLQHDHRLLKKVGWCPEAHIRPGCWMDILVTWILLWVTLPSDVRYFAGTGRFLRTQCLTLSICNGVSGDLSR